MWLVCSCARVHVDVQVCMGGRYGAARVRASVHVCVCMRVCARVCVCACVCVCVYVRPLGLGARALVEVLDPRKVSERVIRPEEFLPAHALAPVHPRVAQW